MAMFTWAGIILHCPRGSVSSTRAGGIATISGNVIIGNNGGSGAYILSGGTLAAMNIVNNDKLKLTGRQARARSRVMSRILGWLRF